MDGRRYHKYSSLKSCFSIFKLVSRETDYDKSQDQFDVSLSSSVDRENRVLSSISLLARFLKRVISRPEKRPEKRETRYTVYRDVPTLPVTCNPKPNDTKILHK